MPSKKIKKASYEAKRARAGYMFVAHWIVGLIVFFAYPLISSILYSFNNVTVDVGQIKTEFVGFEFFKKILVEDPDYVNNVRDSFLELLYALPIIISLSLILAVLLNTKFVGRTVIRAVFFLPVIISSSVVISVMASDSVGMPIFSTGAEGSGMIDYETIIGSLDIPQFILPFITFLMSSTMNLVWNCGVQTILFLAGLQSIPDSLYEVSKIEGANKWEEFWLITVPSLRHIISLVMIYTMIELFTDIDNKIISKASTLINSQQFGESSAMLWFYFMIVIIVILAVYMLYQKLCVKRWE